VGDVLPSSPLAIDASGFATTLKKAAQHARLGTWLY